MPSSRSIQCWKVDANLGSTYGNVSGITLVRYKQDGPIYMTLQDFSRMFKIPKTTIQGHLNTRDKGHHKEQRKSALQSLRDLKCIGRSASSVKLLQVALARNILRILDKPKACIEALSILRETSPHLPTFPSSTPPPPASTMKKKVIGTSPPQLQVPTPGSQGGGFSPRRATPSSTYVFPTTLPSTILQDEQTKERYGYDASSVPPGLKMEIKSFEEWSSVDFNFARGQRYSNAVQSTTITNHLQAIRGYIGYVTKYFNRRDHEATLEYYLDPQMIASFVAYLRARGVEKAHIIKHISIAKKVNFFLQSKSSPSYLAVGETHTTPAHAHSMKLDDWLTTLDLQINQVMPPPETSLSARPTSDNMVQWSYQLCEEAIKKVNHDMATKSSLSLPTSKLVQRAIVTSLCTGCHMPPCRLQFIKTLNHPDYTDIIGCTDADCRMGKGCKGNRLQIMHHDDGDGDHLDHDDGLHMCRQEATNKTSSMLATSAARDHENEDDDSWPYFDYNKTSIKFVIVHGKNDRRKDGVDLEYMLPRGSLAKLLLAHIVQGHGLLTMLNPLPFTRLFASNEGLKFNDSTFVHYWKNNIDNCAIAKQLHIQYFPPSMCRRIFVESYTSAHGVHPSMWDGASLVMGSSTSQWQKTYDPSRKNRLAQASINEHAHYVQRRFLAQVNLSSVAQEE